MAAGFLLCLAWYYTIVSGFFILYCPVMYLMFINHKLYRNVVDALFALWELYPVALFQCCCSTQLHHFGDYVNADEKTIIVMNHRTRVDWNYVWIGLYHATQDPSSNKCICKEYLRDADKSAVSNSILDIGGKSKIKFVLKDELKSVPAMGWIMQLNYFLYVKRNWREDQLNMSQFIDYYKKLNYEFRIVLFPEGTDLSPENKSRSEKFALAHNLPQFDFVLHPRTTGWAVLCARLREIGLASVYDVSIAYDNPAQTELDLLRGNIPSNVYFHVKRYPINEIPIDEDASRKWLNDRWQEKEINLRNFHNKGNFIDPSTNKPSIYRTPRSMVVAKLGFLFWTIINIIFIYTILNNVLFQYWVVYHSLLFVFVTWKFGGFQNVQYKLLDKVIV